MSNFCGILCYVHVHIDLIREVTIFIVASISIQYSTATAKALKRIWLQFNKIADITLFLFCFVFVFLFGFGQLLD